MSDESNDATTSESSFETVVGKRLRARGIDSSELTTDPMATQRSGRGARSPEALAMARHAAEEGASGAVEMGEVIGRGGMGVVREATQRGLDRVVAVKHLPEDGKREGGSVRLLREARISGRLEHPNIIPIHALTRGQDSPMIVMKRVEGVDWGDLLRDDGLHERYGVGNDALGFHLEVLMRLCHAVHFAHSRKILHLDLKPANVMIGQFGETYLLDWGVAASFDDSEDRPRWLPAVSELTTIIGTAAYMAPEQAEGACERLGPRTDVFLLGAILHQLLTGRPPYASKSFDDALVQAFQCAPKTYPASVPEELARIAQKAMARAAEDRFESAEALRRAIARFLGHRASADLVREAEALRHELLPELTSGERMSLSAIDMRDEVLFERRRIECVFAYQQALRLWPDNADARRGLRDFLQLVIERAVRMRDLRTAIAALADYPDADPELRASVDALKAELQEERAKDREAREVAEQVDLNVHIRIRAIGTALTGVAWFVWNMILGWLIRAEIVPLDYRTLFGNLIPSTAACIVATYAVRETVLATRVNRQAISALWSGYAATWALWLGCLALSVEPETAVALLSTLYVFFLCMGISVDPRLWIMAGTTLPFVALSLLDIERVFEWQALLGLICGLTISWVWRAPRDDEGRPSRA